MESKNKSKAKFVRIVCVRCGNPQIIFGKAVTKIKCSKCNRLLMKTSGGKVTIKTVVREVLR